MEFDPNCLTPALRIAELGRTQAVEQYQKTQTKRWQDLDLSEDITKGNKYFAEYAPLHINDGVSTYYVGKVVVVQELNNKILGNKMLVDSIVDDFKATVVERIQKNSNQKVREAWEHKSTWKFVDYKGIQFRVATKDPKILGAIDKAFTDARVEVAARIAELGIGPLYENEPGVLADLNKWFQWERGHSQDVADFRARIARETPGTQNWRSKARNVFSSVKNEFSSVVTMKSLNERGMIVEVNGKKTFSLEVIDFLKKNNSLPRDQLREKFNRELAKPRYWLEFTEEGFDHLFNVVDLSKRFFSLAPMQVERFPVHGVEAPFGLMSTDFVGQGNLNVQTLIGHLMELKNPTADDLLRVARNAEKAATEDLKVAAFQLNKDADPLFRSWFKLSGDDGVIALKESIPELNFRQFIQAVSKSGAARRYRFIATEGKFSGTNEVVPPEIRSQWVLKAENLEKVVIAHAGGKLFEPLGRDFLSVMNSSAFLFKIEISKQPTTKSKLFVYISHLTGKNAFFAHEVKAYFTEHPPLDFEVSFR